MSYPQDRYASQPPPPPGAQQQQSSSPWNPASTGGGGAPAPPPRPPSNPTGPGGGYSTSYTNYPTYNPGGGAYNNGYDNPYSGYYDQPAYDNPNSLYTSTGQVVSSQQLPTPTAYDQQNQNPFLTPVAGQSHPSLYNENPTIPTSSSAASASHRYDSPYGGVNELGGFAQRPGSAVNPDRYNTPAPLPGSSSQSPPPIGGRKKVQLSDSGFPPVGSRASRYGDEEGLLGGDASEMALLGPPGGGRGHAGDRFSVGGFNPEILGEDDDSNIRYGRIPQRVPRRYKTKKRYELFHGNLVIDNEVPSKLLDMCPLKTEREFKFMRYTAATCDPNDFKSEGYTLRPAMYEPARKTELFIVMTMYNEDEELFSRSMSGVMKNIQHLITRERSKTWGKEGWKKVVVCIVSDGRSKINSRTLSVIAAMGAYQDGVAKNAVNGKPVTAHIYEYTSQISVTPPAKIGPQKEPAPIQIIFCLKEKNQKKINSHRWFFNAFGPVLEPNVCVLLDVGTMPGPTSIYHLWKSFDINSNVGGACGEIVALKGKFGVNLLNPLVAAQNFEYKMSNILDKPLESVFGYITVLPGAFSAYRYIALQNDAMGEGPLQKYFLGEKMHGAGADIFTANMYLAEDRILCWELVSKRGGQWILHYVKSAYAETDVPDQVPELISQRRRWLNGSFFAAIHSTVKFNYIYRSSHTTLRKFWIHVELVYQVFNLIFSWFALGNFYIAFYILSSAIEDPSFGIPAIKVVNAVLNYAYLGLVVMCYLLALGNRPQGSKWGYIIAFIGFAIITLYMTFTAWFLAFKSISDIAATGTANGFLTVGDFFTNAIFRNIVVSMLATLGLYIFASLLFFEPWHMITSFVQYLLMAPSYITVLNVYAFANVHDVSWGTKGDNKVSTDLGAATVGGKNKNEVEVVIPTEQKDINAAYEDALHVIAEKPPKVEQKRDASTKQEDYYRNFRTNVLLAWTLSNGLLGAVVVSTAAKASESSAQDAVKGYMSFVLISVAGLAFVRFCGSTAYMLIRLFAGE